MTRIYELQEEKETEIKKDELDEKIAVILFENYGKLVSVDFPTAIKNRYILRPNGYIGQIPVSEDVLIRIEPKVPIDNVFKMLEYAYGLKSFQFLDGRVELKKIDDLFEELASVLSKMVLERNRKGLYRDYVRREEPLPYIKGRILIRKSLKSSVRGAINLDCEYDENTADIMDNRILAWTLYRIPRLNIQREEIRRQVGRAYRAISGSVDVNHVNSTDCINRFYHRLNEDYRPMHALCRFFLEQCGPMTDNGDHEFLPFVLNMPILFESFVAEWLRANLPSEMQLKSQFWADLDSEGILSFRIDLVIEDIASGKVLAVLDTKYKRPAMPSQQDITQIIAYAVRMGTDKAFLIYPSVATNIMDFKTGDINVGSLIFDISKNPDDSGNLFLQTLINKINMN